MQNPTQLQEFAAQFFANMSLADLMVNNPYVTTKAYAEVGYCENNGDAFTEVSWAWEEAFEARIEAHAAKKASWIVLQKEVHRQQRTTFILASDQVLLEQLRNEGWEMTAYYGSFTAWSEENAKDRMKGQVFTAWFYAHELEEELTWLAANHQIDLTELAEIEANSMEEVSKFVQEAYLQELSKYVEACLQEQINKENS